jgi:hypothetical protein
MNTEQKLTQKLENLKMKLDIELRRENALLARRGFGYAQRNTKIGFSTRKSDNLKERIDKIESELNKLKTV